MRGFTLLEMVVAMGIFALIAGAVLSLLISSISIQRNALGQQALVDEMSFIAEYMSRALRQAQKEPVGGGDCMPPLRNYDDGGTNTMTFLDRNKKCTVITFNTVNKVVEESKSNDEAAPPPNSEIPLTSNRLEVLFGGFEVSGDEPVNNSMQPRITFVEEVKSSKGVVRFRLQTTVSQRLYDVLP